MGTESAGIGSEIRPPPPQEESARRLPPERPRYSDTQAVGGGLGRLRNLDAQRRIAAGLGWFSIGLGLFELAAPRTLARLIGIDPPWTRWTSRAGADRASRWLPSSAGRWAALRAARRLPQPLYPLSPANALILRGLGVREIVSGIGILARPRPAGWLWSRVAGDMMDLSLLGLALSSRQHNRARLAGATAAALAVTALDVFCSVEFTRTHRRTRRSWTTLRRGVPVEASVAINRPPEDCYRLWRDLENLPRFMRSVESIRVENDRRSHWVAKAPGGIRMEWDSEITHDTPNRLISWRSTSGDVPNVGSVHFDPAPGGRGCLVRVRLTHDLPGAVLPRFAAKLFGKVPRSQIREDLRRFKQILEAGEVATTRGQSSGRRSLIARTFRGDSSHEG